MARFNGDRILLGGDNLEIYDVNLQRKIISIEPAGSFGVRDFDMYNDWLVYSDIEATRVLEVSNLEIKQVALELPAARSLQLYK